MKKSLKQAVLRGITLLLVTQTGYVLAAPTEGVEFSIRWDAASSVYRVYVRPIATPTPDALSMAIMLIPLMFLYEISIFFVAWLGKPREVDESI